jgi:hypothetical protein
MSLPDHRSGPFALDDPTAYQQWRDAKLKACPESVSALIVEVADPRRLRTVERQALVASIRRCGMAIYASRLGPSADKSIVSGLGRQFGLERLDHNLGADDDAITSLQVRHDPLHARYIPYSSRPISWHTDGYYNPPDTPIRSLILHCVRPARSGGVNQLFDNEIAYLLLRDANPDYIHALSHPTAMTIPPNTDLAGTSRPAVTGPVFSVRSDGQLHLRYTARKRNVIWRDDPLTREAAAYLLQLLETPSRFRWEAKLEAGWGLICRNSLHNRSGFEDASERLLYRGRYFDALR